MAMRSHRRQRDMSGISANTAITMVTRHSLLRWPVIIGLLRRPVVSVTTMARHSVLWWPVRSVAGPMYAPDSPAAAEDTTIQDAETYPGRITRLSGCTVDNAGQAQAARRLFVVRSREKKQRQPRSIIMHSLKRRSGSYKQSSLAISTSPLYAQGHGPRRQPSVMSRRMCTAARVGEATTERAPLSESGFRSTKGGVICPP